MKKIIKYTLFILVFIITILKFNSNIFAIENNNTHANGIYKLALGVNSGKTIQLAASSTSNNASIEIWDYGNIPAQKFYFEYQKEGFYKITSMVSGKSLTIQKNEIKEKASIVQYDYQGLDSQKWILKDSKINGWVISPLTNPDLCISIDGTIKNGAKIVLSKIQNNKNQLFYVFNITTSEKQKTNGIYKIALGLDSNKTLEVLKGEKTNNTALNLNKYRKYILSKILF